MSMIKVNYEALESSHTEMQASAKGLDQKLDDLRKRLDALQWEGQDRAAYEIHKASWDAAVRDINQILNEIGGAVGVARENYVTTEMSNTRLWG